MHTADGRSAARAILDAGKSTSHDVPKPTQDDDVDGVDVALEEAWSAAFDRKDKEGFKKAIRSAMVMNHHAQSSDDAEEQNESGTERSYER